MKNRKFKNYFIYPSFQISLILTNVIVAIICLVIVRYKIVSVFDKLKDMGEKASLPLTHPYYEFVAHSKEMMVTNLTWAICFCLVLTTLSSIYLSHKMVGPIYRLKMYFTSLNEDINQKDITFRKGDYFSELPELINSALKKVRSSRAE